MLKKYPTLLFVVHRSGWYLLTFLVAITINFFLPRFGADPIELITSKMKGNNAKQIHQKKVAFMKEFGLVETEGVTTTSNGTLLLDNEANPISFETLQSVATLNELESYWASSVTITDRDLFVNTLKNVLGGKSAFLRTLPNELLDEEAVLEALRNELTLEDMKALAGVEFGNETQIYTIETSALNNAIGSTVSLVSEDADIPFLVRDNGESKIFTYTSKLDLTPTVLEETVAVTESTIDIVASTEVVNSIEVSEAGNESFAPVKRPLIKQYFTYLFMVIQGDLGTSFNKYPKKVNTIVAEAIPWTLALQFPTIVIGWLVGNMLGALAAYKRGLFDKVLFPAALLTNSIPFFAVGMLLVYVFAELFPIFPASGGYAIDVVPGLTWAFISSAAFYYVLPFFSIMPVFAAGQATGMRTMGIYELGTGYVKYAKTLGIKENKILMYIFRNAMLPQLTGLALMLGVMIGGALITEMIFSYPGLGMALLTAAQNNDYPLIQGAALIVTVTVLLANFSVDILIGFFDPRVKAGRTGA